jgi:hypothetical protein
MINRVLCIGAALGALTLAAGAAPAKAAPVAGLDATARPALVHEAGYKYRRRYNHGSYVRAPFTEVDSRRGTWVAAPFVRVYSGRRGTWVRAPFVNLWSPH